jgi:hypothetical protein
MSQDQRAYLPYAQPYGYHHYPMYPHHHGTYPIHHPHGYHDGYHDGFYHGYQHALDLHVHVDRNRNPSDAYMPTEIN